MELRSIDTEFRASARTVASSWIRIPGVSQKSDTYWLGYFFLAKNWLGYLYRTRLGGMGYGPVRQTDLQARSFRVTFRSNRRNRQSQARSYELVYIMDKNSLMVP
jgi:hypothetical protein